jgi:mannose-6-phosphate isomerase-like protein (cupin superfamily)
VDRSVTEQKPSIGANEHEERPWGSFHVLDEGTGYKVKRIEVFPGKRLSYQRHAHRSEHWFVTRGTAKVTLNDREILVKTGESIDIRIGDKHRVENPESQTLIFIETQTGDYFGEDDIERFDDDFGRAGPDPAA